MSGRPRRRSTRGLKENVELPATPPRPPSRPSRSSNRPLNKRARVQRQADKENEVAEASPRKQAKLQQPRKKGRPLQPLGQRDVNTNANADRKSMQVDRIDHRDKDEAKEPLGVTEKAQMHVDSNNGVVDDDDDDDDQASHDKQPDGEDTRQHERMLDDSSSADKVVATQPPRGQKEGSRLRAGYIKKIVLQNFMAHVHMAFSFSPQVNFIHGTNGSGKSAVLAALQVGLGCRASETNRGSSMAQFVRTGCDQAFIQITLANEGGEAYCPETFGKEIVVERVLSRSGASSFRLRSGGALGNKVVTRQRAELEAMLRFFNIQITNPVVVTDQTTSREFLQTSSGSDLYRFFLKATELQHMQEFLSSSRANQLEWSQQLKVKRGSLAGLMQAVEESKKFYKLGKKLHSVQETIAELRGQLLWAHHLDKERRAEAIAERSAEARDRIRLLQAKKQKRLQAKEAQAGVTLLRTKLERVDGEADECKKEMASLRTLHRKQVKTVASVERQLQERSRQLQASRQRRDKLRAQQKRWAQQQRNPEAPMDAERALQESQVCLDERKGQYEQCKRDAHTANDALTEHQTTLRLAEQRVASLRADRDEATEECTRLKRQAKDQLSRFGASAPLIQKLIHANRRKFGRIPKGPLGSYVRVRRDMQYASQAVEVCLGRVLTSYVAHDEKDRRVLSSLITQAMEQLRVSGARKERFPDIFTRRELGEKLDARSVTVQGLPTVLDAIEVDDPWAFNMIVDQSSPEQWVIVGEPLKSGDSSSSSKRQADNRACALAFDIIKGYTRPRDRGALVLRGCITLLGSRVEKRGTTIRMQPPTSTAAKRLGVDAASELPRWKRALEDAEYQLNKGHGELAAVERVLAKRKATLLAARRAERAALTAMHESMSDLKEAEEERRVCMEGMEQDNDAVLEELQRAQAEVESHKESHLVVGNELHTQIENREVLEKRLTAVRARSESVEAEQEHARSKLQVWLSSSDVRSRKIRRYDDEVEALEAEVKQLGDEHAELLQQSKQAEAAAREVHPDPVSPEDSPAELLSKIEALEQVVKDERARLHVSGSRDVTQRYYSAEKALETAQNDIKKLENNLKELHRSQREREKEWRAFRQHVSVHANLQFGEHMERQSHAGFMRFDHKNKSLDLEVSVGGADGQRDGPTDSKSLSGGERSFSTLAFVLALGEGIRCPFRAIDEFDVFMDCVNRKHSLDLLVTECLERQQTTQFIFITPLDISSLGGRKGVRILKLRKLDAKQRTIKL